MMLNSVHHLQWFDKLLAALKQPPLIILEEANYHLVPEAYNSPDIKRIRMGHYQQFLHERGVDVAKQGSHSPVAALKTPNGAWVGENVKKGITKREDAKRHRVVLIPLHYSPLQHMELFWIEVKGEVGRAYGKGTKMADVEMRLKASLKQKAARHQLRPALRRWQDLLPGHD